MVIPCGSNSRGVHGALMRLSAGTSPDDFIDQIKNHRCNRSMIRHRTIDKSRWNGHRCLSARSGSHLVRSSVLRAEHTQGLLQPMTVNFESSPRQKYLKLCKAVNYAEQASCILYDQQVSSNNSERSSRTAFVSAFVMFGHERSSPSSRRLKKNG